MPGSDRPWRWVESRQSAIAHCDVDWPRRFKLQTTACSLLTPRRANHQSSEEAGLFLLGPTFIETIGLEISVAERPKREQREESITAAVTYSCLHFALEFVKEAPVRTFRDNCGGWGIDQTYFP